MKKSKLKTIALDMWVNSNYLDKIILKELNLSKSGLFLIDEIDEKYIEEITNKLKRIENKEPLEYVINNAEFYNLDFYVDNKVLIPRNDTEIMVDMAIEEILQQDSITLIDVWTWSSCIAISILENTKKINNCYVVDISNDALDVSKKNISKHNLLNKIIQINWNLISDFIWINDFQINKNIIITANLPYIKNNDFINMDQETIRFEPEIALYWWKNTWFELYEQLIRECFQFKNIKHIQSLILFIEIGFDQFEYSRQYLDKLNLNFKYFKDNNWINRCIKIVF